MKLCRDCKYVSGALLDNVAGCEAPENGAEINSPVTGLQLYHFHTAWDARMSSVIGCTLEAKWFQEKVKPKYEPGAIVQVTRVKKASDITLMDL